MDIQKYIKRPLEIAYVQGILDKIAHTFQKYEPIFPEIEDVIRDIVKKQPESQFGAVVIILQTLKKYQPTSPFISEVAEGVRQDFWHGINEAYEKHEGEFYISSVAD